MHGDDGKVRAFSNVCRHHAARVCEGEGRTDALVCPYHQWTYNLQGRLTKSTRMKGIQDFAASKVRLPELPLEVWGPFVFVLADPAAAVHVPSVAVQMEAIQRDFEGSSGWEGGAVPWRSLKVNAPPPLSPSPSLSACAQLPPPPSPSPRAAPAPPRVLHQVQLEGLHRQLSRRWLSHPPSAQGSCLGT